MTEVFYITKRTGQRLQVTLSNDDADLARWTWHMAGGTGSVAKYPARKTDQGTVYLHREVALRMGLVGALKGEGRSVGSVDHINGDKLDCRRENLRLRSRKQQMLNPNDRLRSNNTSGYRGVSFDRRVKQAKKPWLAYVREDYKTKCLGTFATIEEAVQARREWEAMT